MRRFLSSSRPLPTYQLAYFLGRLEAKREEAMRRGNYGLANKLFEAEAEVDRELRRRWRAWMARRRAWGTRF